MGFREVKVFDRDFPTNDQIISGDPTQGPWPQEVWMNEIQPGEHAVRYKHFQTGLSWGADGKHLANQSTEICRIFETLEEAKSHARQIAEQHPIVICAIYDHTAKQVDTVHNRKEVSKFAAYFWLSLLLQAGFLSLLGMALLWLLYRSILLVTRPANPPIHLLTWYEWCAFAAAGLGIGIFIYLAKVRLKASKRVKKVNANFTKEEWAHYEQLNTLYVTADPDERKRFHELKKEFEERVQKTLKE
jgi:hypothetical protein